MPIEFTTLPNLDLKRYFMANLPLGFAEYQNKEWLKFDVGVVNSKPKQDAVYPVVEIRRMSDPETHPSITDYLGDYEDEEAGDYVEIYGTQFTETIQLIIHTTDSDQRDWLHPVVKALLFDMRDDLADNGIAEQRISGLGDSEDDSIPGHRFYMSTIQFSGINQMSKYERVETIKAVDVKYRIMGEERCG